MREIKFRVWVASTEEMLWARSLRWSNRGVLHVSPEGWNNSDPIDGKDCFIMQYTGLKDKNGREIYEGDILKLINVFSTEIIEVKQPELFECDAFMVYGYKFCSGWFIDDYNNLNLRRFYSCNPEVIGNIYENPELLKQ